MAQSSSINYASISCYLILLLNIIYFLFTLTKIYLQYQRRKHLPIRQARKMTDQTNELPTTRMATRSTTAAAAAAAAASVTLKPTHHKYGYEKLSRIYPHVPDDVHLPMKWNGKEKASTLVLLQNDLIVTYKGPGKSHKDAASVRSDYPIPPLTGIYYFEVKILSKGRDGYMGIGLSTSEVSLHRLPGWDKGSYGYHGDDGHSFCSSGSGIVYGPTFTTGDYVGCCVNFLDNSCFYTRNGYNLGTSFRDIPNEIYPTIGLQTPNESIEANFGLSPFKFDIEKYMDEYREKTRRSIIDSALKEGELLHQTQLRRIVSTYLVHYGYCATAEQFNKNAESVYTDELNSMRNRQLIQHLILEGRTTDAIEKTKELFPTLLNDKNLLFVLKVRQFIEMINGTESEIHQSSTSNSPSILSQSTPPTTNLLLNTKTSSSARSASPLTKTTTSSRSRSNSPYASGRSGTQTPHTNGTVNLSSHRSSANNNTEPSQETPSSSTVNSSLPPTIGNLMDIDETSPSNNSNGFSSHGTVGSPNTISNGNGCRKKSSDLLDGMECDGHQESTPTTEMETTISNDVQRKSMIREDEQLLIRILQFGRELHALKQQLTVEYGENAQHEKMLQEAFSLLAYSDPKTSPLATLLEPSQRESVSGAVNSAILEAHDMPRHPALEVLAGYLHECDKLMHKNNIPDCAFMDLNKYLR